MAEARIDAIMDALEDLGYLIPLSVLTLTVSRQSVPEVEEFEQILQQGTDNKSFVDMCCLLANAIGGLVGLDEQVSAGKAASSYLSS